MKKLNWKAPAVYTTIGAIVGSTLMSSPAALAEQNFKSYWAKFAQNGQQSGSAAAILYGGTNYFGIYYLQQLLKQDGINVSWDGKELQLNGVPVQQTTTLSVSGSTPSSSTTSPLLTDSIQVNGVTYVPLATVQAMLSASGVHLNEGDRQDGSGSNNTTSSISAGSVQSVIEHLKEAVGSLSEYAQIAAKLQQQTSLLQGLFASRDHGNNGDTKEALQQLASAMQKMQAAYTNLTALATTASSTSTSGTSGIGTTGTTTTAGTSSGTGSTDTSGTSTTSGSGTGSGSSTSTTPTAPSSADLATQLQTIAAAIQQDITTLNGLALASLGTSPSGSTGSTSNSTSGTSGTTTGTSGTTTGTSTTGSDTTGGSGTTAGTASGTATGTTTTPTSPTASPADVSGVVSDLQQQIQLLQAIQAQLGGGDTSGSSSHGH